jgi:hypothetical protein
MGRHFENWDGGYSCYSGFLHMEAMHTNPIIICFCSLLYYKGLDAEYLLERFKIERKNRNSLVRNVENRKMINLVKLHKRRRVSINDSYESSKNSEVSNRSDVMMNKQNEENKDKNNLELANKLGAYNRRVLIRWHLLLRMSLNPEIIKYRKIYLKTRVVNANK